MAQQRVQQPLPSTESDGAGEGGFLKLAREYAYLDAERRELEQRLDVVKEELAGRQAALLIGFENHDIAGSLKLREVGLALYVHRQRWVSAVPERIAELQTALSRLGAGWLVKPSVNSQALSAWVRERDANGEEIPPDVLGAVNDKVVYSIRTRKAGGK